MRQTSIESYQRIKDNGLLSKRRFQVYETLFHHGPMTQNECWAKIYHSGEGSHVAKQSINPRFAELERRGVIVPIEKRTCEVSGVTCLTWDVTSSLPTRPEKTKTWKQRYEEAAREIEELKRRLGE